MRYESAQRVASVALERYAVARGFGTAGIFNPRNVRGGTALSLHAEGRAVDLTPNIFTAKYVRGGATGTCTFLRRKIIVIPLA